MNPNPQSWPYSYNYHQIIPSQTCKYIDNHTILCRDPIQASPTSKKLKKPEKLVKPVRVTWRTTLYRQAVQNKNPENGL